MGTCEHLRVGRCLGERQLEGAEGEKEARGQFTLCVNHCDGKTERQKGQWAGLTRWK